MYPYLPQMTQYPYQPTQPPLPKQEVVKVSGENGARAYQMPANSSALLLDESGELLWLVTTDGAGYKTVGAFDITPHQAAPAPDYASLEERITKLEGLIDGITSDIANARSKPADVSTGSTAPAGKRYDAYGADRKQPAGYNAGNSG